MSTIITHQIHSPPFEVRLGYKKKWAQNINIYTILAIFFKKSGQRHEIKNYAKRHFENKEKEDAFNLFIYYFLIKFITIFKY